MSTRKIAREQKEFLKEMKKKFSNDDTIPIREYVCIDPDHITIGNTQDNNPWLK